MASLRAGPEITESKSETDGDTVVVRYSSGGAVCLAIFGVGMLAITLLIGTSGGSASRFVFALIPLAFGLGLTLLASRMWRDDRHAIVINDDTLDIRFLNGTRVRVPWSEVRGVRATKVNDEPYVSLDLHAPRAHFYVKKGKGFLWKIGADRPTLLVHASRLVLDTKRERLLEVIRAHLPNADDVG